MIKRVAATVPLILILLLSLSGCLGLDADAVIKADGSGTLKIAYRLSRLVESMARVAGARQFPVPIEKIDFEHTVARIPGLKLKSYAIEEDEKDISVRAELAFDTIAAFIAFLDGTGHAATYGTVNGKHQLRLSFSEGGEEPDPELVTLMRTIFDGYAVTLRIKPPVKPTSSPRGAVDASGVAIFSMPVVDLVDTKDAIFWEIGW